MPKINQMDMREPPDVLGNCRVDCRKNQMRAPTMTMAATFVKDEGTVIKRKIYS